MVMTVRLSSRILCIFAEYWCKAYPAALRWQRRHSRYAQFYSPEAMYGLVRDSSPSQNPSALNALLQVQALREEAARAAALKAAKKVAKKEEKAAKKEAKAAKKARKRGSPEPAPALLLPPRAQSPPTKRRRTSR